MMLLNYFASRAWRKATQSHWTEQARLLYPARHSVPVNLILIGGCGVLFGLGYTRPTPALLLIALAAFIGAVIGTFPFERKIFRELTWRSWLTQALQGWGSRILLFGPIVLISVLMPDAWNWQVPVIALLFAIFYLWFGSVGYFQVLIWLKLLKPADTQTIKLLDPCFNTTNLRPRAVWVMQAPLALAFAVPTRNELLFTDSFLTRLDPEDIRAVTYHELAHLTEDKLTVARRLLGLLIFYPFIFLRPLGATWGLPGFIPIYAVFGLLLYLNIRIGKKMEHRADSEAILRQTDEGSYARALEKLYHINLIPAVMPSHGQIHPHLYDRMLAAGVTPNFPRPKPPGTLHWTFIIPIVIGVYFAIQNIR